jgi:hypothetical protein
MAAFRCCMCWRRISGSVRFNDKTLSRHPAALLTRAIMMNPEALPARDAWNQTLGRMKGGVRGSNPLPAPIPCPPRFCGNFMTTPLVKQENQIDRPRAREGTFDCPVT